VCDWKHTGPAALALGQLHTEETDHSVNFNRRQIDESNPSQTTGKAIRGSLLAASKETDLR
jgi:hypothetical protein